MMNAKPVMPILIMTVYKIVQAHGAVIPLKIVLVNVQLVLMLVGLVMAGVMVQIWLMV
jgi:hypothetical protein